MFSSHYFPNVLLSKHELIYCACSINKSHWRTLWSRCLQLHSPPLTAAGCWMLHVYVDASPRHFITMCLFSLLTRQLCVSSSTHAVVIWSDTISIHRAQGVTLCLTRRHPERTHTHPQRYRLLLHTQTAVCTQTRWALHSVSPQSNTGLLLVIIMQGDGCLLWIYSRNCTLASRKSKAGVK